MGVVVSWLWRQSLWVTLPAALLFIFVAVNTAENFRDFKVKYDSGGPGVISGAIFPTAERKVAKMLSDVVRGLRPKQFLPEELPILHLFVQESQLNRLEADRPYSGRDYVAGKMLYPNGKVYPVKVKHRGDFLYHWAFERASLRVKTKKKRLYEGMRQFNLIIPKYPSIVNDHIAFELARDLGLMAPESDIVLLAVNGRIDGIRLKVAQPGETMLRRNGRMPGDLYVGDAIGGDAYTDADNYVFANPTYWTKAAVNNHFEEDDRRPLVALLDALREDDDAALLSLLDLDQWARFAAFVALARTIHFDETHNWRIFFDPAKGVFQPLVWDPTGWHPNMDRMVNRYHNRVELGSSILLRRLYRNEAFLQRLHGELRAFFERGGDRAVLARAEDAVERVRKDLSFETFPVYSFGRVESRGKVEAAMQDFLRTLESVLEDLRTTLDAPPKVRVYQERDGGAYVYVNGTAHAAGLELHFANPVADFELAVRHPGEEVLRPAAGAQVHVGHRSTVVRYEAGLWTTRASESALGNQEVKLKTAEYQLAWTQADTGNPLVDVFALDVNGGKVPVERIDARPVPMTLLANEPPGAAMEPSVVRFGGEVAVTGVREIDAEVEIVPGTRFLLGPGASLVFKRRVNAIGTRDDPILFVRQRPDSPWGAVVLQGSGTSGSRFQHVRFAGGSGLYHRLIEYSGMVSVHDAGDVEFSSCEFSRNDRFDDMVHAVYSRLQFRDTRFTAARADALDLDYSQAVIRGSEFGGSGNDALDLMSSQAFVVDSVLTGSGDKGISVGEGSDVLIARVRLEDNNIGIEVKDGSRAWLANTDVLDNKTGVHAYKKNWQYGSGGYAWVAKSRLIANGEATSADKRSRIRTNDVELRDTPGPVTDPSCRAQSESWPDDWNSNTWHPLLKQYAHELDPSRRGWRCQEFRSGPG